MLRLQRLARVPGAETLPLAEGRDVLRDTAAHTGGDQPIGSVRVLRGGATCRPGSTCPTGAPPAGPLLVFFHGGGFWCGDLDSHDPPAGSWPSRSGVRVLSVDYRLAPEHPFPAAYDDAAAAYAWTVEHAAELGADPARLGVGGDSAGGNLAAGVAIEAARHGWPCAVQLLVYPATQARRETRSAELFGEGFYLTRASWTGPTGYYATDVPADDPRLSPLHAELPAGLAPALVFTAGFDPLRDEGEAYAERLATAGVEVELTRFADQIHGFFNIVGVGRTSRAANLRIARALGSRVVVKGSPGRGYPRRVRRILSLSSSRCSRRPRSVRPPAPWRPGRAPRPRSAATRGRCSSVTPTSSAVAAAPTRSRTWPTWPAPSSATARPSGAPAAPASSPPTPTTTSRRTSGRSATARSTCATRELVVIAGGSNDVGLPVAQVKKNATKILRIARTQVPAGAAGPGRADGPVRRLRRQHPDPRRPQAVAKKLDVPFIDDMTWLAGHPDWLCDDYVHPTYAAQGPLGERLAKALRKRGA